MPINKKGINFMANKKLLMVVVAFSLISNHVNMNMLANPIVLPHNPLEDLTKQEDEDNKGLSKLKINRASH